MSNNLDDYDADAAFARRLIDFDPDDPSTYSTWSLPTTAASGQSSVVSGQPVANAAMRAASAVAMAAAKPKPAIPWPAGLAPVPVPLLQRPQPTDALPACDYLAVTWTVAEAKALADVLTPGCDSRTDWYPYAKDFDSIYAPLIRKGAPAYDSRRLGSYFLTEIGGKKVLCYKSELHMSQDGPKLPVRLLWKQLIAETQPKMVITTGTAGGIGGGVVLGDVIIGKAVRFDCIRSFKNAAFHNGYYHCSPVSRKYLKSAAKNLMSTVKSQLPASPRAPKIFYGDWEQVRPINVVTTDFFAFDDTTNYYGLQGRGSAVEMGDAVLGLAIHDLGRGAPRWTAIRNASDPQMDGGQPLAAQTKTAAQIYEKYGYWTTVCSAIATWAVIAGE